MNVPLVLSKSRTKTWSLLTMTAQCRLLMSALAGRRLHSGSRPITNWANLIGMTCPCALPAVVTTKLSFIADLDTVGISFRKSDVPGERSVSSQAYLRKFVLAYGDGPIREHQSMAVR